MPFLRDEGPPLSQGTIQKLRESLPVEYGWQLANEKGREVLAVRVPKAKPDYLHDLAEVAFYVGLDQVRSTKDVLLIGHEKTARLEPQLLRDHIRAQAREDSGVVDHLRRSLDRQYGHSFVQSPSNFQHQAFCVRIPKETVAQFTPDDVNAIRQLVTNLRPKVMECQYAYVVANGDFERLGRRTLLELIGEAAAPPAPVAPAAPAPLPFVAPPAAAAPPPPAAPVVAAPVQRTPFPTSPSGATLPPAPPAPVAAAPSLFTPPPAVAAPTPAPAPAEAAIVADHEEYQIVSKPKPAPAPAPAPAPVAASASETAVHEEYEIVSKPKPVEAPSPQPQAPAEPQPEKTVLHAEKEYEVFTSKPKAKPEPVGITPPGMGGFQAALAAAGQAAAAPAKTKEYEIMGRASAPAHSDVLAAKLRAQAQAAAAPAAPVMAPAPFPPVAQQAPPPPPSGLAAALAHVTAAAPPQPMAPPAVLPPRVATPTTPVADSGAPVVVRTVPAAPEAILASRFKEAGYEVVEGLRAQGTVFAFAAHKPNGRRVLVKRAESFGPEDAATLAQLVAALGADVALVAADTVRPGTRLATWGTRIEVLASADVSQATF